MLYVPLGFIGFIVRFEALVAALMKIQCLWDVTRVNTCRHLGEA